MVNEMNQPIRGLVPTLMVLIVSSMFIFIGQFFFKMEAGTIAVYALFFTWTAFIISLCERWPCQNLRQPLAGTIFLTAALAIGFLHPFVISAMGYDTSYHWPLISNLFLAIGLVITFENRLVAGLGQPKALILNSLFMYVIAVLILLAFGFVPAIWFPMFILMIFWFDSWPMTKTAQPAKGILLLTCMASMALILEFVFVKLGTDFFHADAGLWFVLWVWWLVLLSWQFETWPFGRCVQPWKGILGLITTVTLALLSYFVIVTVLKMDEAIAGSFVWVFVSWLYAWDIIFGKWPTDRPIKT